jgi:hypothetical protein
MSRVRLEPTVLIVGILVGILIFSFVAFSTSLSTVTIYSSGTIEPLSLQLHVSGTQLLNANNQIVYLRGVNWQDFLETSTGDFLSAGQTYSQLNPNWSNASVQATCAQWQSQGLNFIRILIPCDWWLSNSALTYQDGTTAIGMRTAITDFVQIAQSYGLYIEICPWEILGYPESGQPPSGDQPWQTPSQTLITTEAQFVSLWAGTATSIANVLGSYPNVIFSLFNEPPGNEAAWGAACQDCINAIRQVSQNCIVVEYGYCGYFGFPADFNLNGTNIIYDDHIYTGSDNTFTNTADYSTAQLNATLYNTWDYGATVGQYCFMIDEIGCNLGATNELTYYANMLGLLDSWGAGYAGWVYVPGAGNGYCLVQGSAFPYSWNSAGLELAAAIQAGNSGIYFSDEGASTNVAGTSCTFSCLISGLTSNITSYTFSNTNSGSWVNGSTVSANAASLWANVTLTLTATSGTIVSYEWYATTSTGTASSGVFILETVPSASVLFVDSFESGDFSLWSGTIINTAGTASVQSSVVYSGCSYAAEMSVGTASGSTIYGADCYEELSTTYSTLYARAYVRFSITPSTGNSFQIGPNIGDANDVDDLVCLNLINSGGTLYWQLGYLNNGAWTTDNIASPTITANTWYCVEIMDKAASGTGQVSLWINGVLAANMTGLTNNADLPQQVYLTATTTSQSNINVYYDDCEIATAGPIGTM